MGAREQGICTQRLDQAPATPTGQLVTRDAEGSGARQMRLVVVLSLFASAAVAQPDLVDAGTALAPVPAGRVALYASTSTLAAVTTAGVAVLVGSMLPTLVFNQQGRPDPLALAGGLTLAVLLDVVVLHLTLPLLTTLGAVDGVTADPSAGRDHAWRRSRWALIGAAVGAVMLTAGSIAERDRFASGQWAMLAGAGTLLVSGVAFDVLEAVFAWQGFVAARRVAP